jgi:hypothetical protein
VFSEISVMFSVSSYSDIRETVERCELVSLLHVSDVLILLSASVSICSFPVGNSQGFFV